MKSKNHTASGILVVNSERKIVSLNRNFLEMWGLPEFVIASRDDDLALAFVLEQLKDAETFLTQVRNLYMQPVVESYDIIEFKDGRIFERYSQPHWFKGKSVGRVWQFHDVTERKRLEASLLKEIEHFQLYSLGVSLALNR